MKIRDGVLRKQFASNELVAVKRRWELCTIIYTIAFALALLMYWQRDSPDQMIKFILEVSDCWIVFVLFAIIGRKWAKVHHFSLMILIIVRAAFTIVQVQLFMRDVEPLNEKFDIFSYHMNSILQVMVPISMLFLTDFRQYVYVIFPLTLIV